MTKLCVAGLPMQVESGDKDYFAGRYADYVCTDERPPQFTMRTTLLDPVPTPEGELVERLENVSILRLPDGRTCRYGVNPAGKINFAIYNTPGYAEVDIQLLSTRKNPHLSQRDWEYMYTGFSFNNRLSTLGGGILHSSALAYKGQGIAFSANSGTGKSTHVGLWKQRFGDLVDIINDDKPAIIFEDDKPILCGTPWSGKTALNVNKQVPLRAIVIVERGEKNSIRRLDVVESMYHLANQINRPYFDAQLGLKILDFTERLLESVPVYCLACNISQEAVETVFREIFPEEEL